MAQYAVIFRISVEEKQAFKAATALEGRTQTEVLREFVRDFLARTPTERRTEAA